MSRGPGAAQVRVLDALAAYDRLGRSLGWQWSAGGSFYRQRLACLSDITAYEAGRRVETYVLRRDTGLSAPEVSRALHSLARQQYVWLYGADASDLSPPCGLRGVKFSQISSAGLEWLSANKNKKTKLAVSGAEAAR